MSTNEHFDTGFSEALKVAQQQANREGRSVRVGEVWVNPSSASLAKRPRFDNINKGFAEGKALK